MLFSIFLTVWSVLQVQLSKYEYQGKNWLAVELMIPPGHYVYGNKPQDGVKPLKVDVQGVDAKDMRYEPPVHDLEMDLDIYKDNVVILMPYSGEKSHIKVSYGMCTDTVCLPPATIEKDFQYNQLPTIDPVTCSRYQALCECKKSWSIWPFIFAFLGGLLLNIMPCILPVLSLKVISFLQNTTNRLQHSLLYAAGNITTFVGLGLLTGVLKLMGNIGGWGFHLQNPVFVCGLMCVFVLMVMSIFDLIVFPALQTSTPKTSFWSGVMTVIVGAPCCMPLMSTAVSYGLTQSIWESILIFMFLGIGMATPFLVLSFVPINFLPKPGNWLQWVKPTLGFLLIISIMWLLQIYTALTSLDHFLIMAGILVAFAYVLWIWGQSFVKGWVALMLACSLSIGGMIYSMHKSTPSIVYSQSNLEKAIADGKDVLIYITAKWCLSCKVNSFILDKQSTRSLLKEHNTILMIADYTNQDEDVTFLLRKHNLAGVPALLLVQGQKTRILPEIITEKDLKDIFASS